MRPKASLTWFLPSLLIVSFISACSSQDAAEVDPSLGQGWAHYGGDAGGTRYSALNQINRGNVGALTPVWVYRTGEFDHDSGDDGGADAGGERPTGCAGCHTGEAKFEATPILADGKLFIGTPMNRILAIDPSTGVEQWAFDPKVRTDIDRNEGFVSRGASYWAQHDTLGGAGPTCGNRIFMGTIDAQLVAVDARTGQPCADFGNNGIVQLDEGVGAVQEGNFGVTSPPAIVGDVVIVGTSQGDNRLANSEWGTVRGYDARTGVLLWSFNPIPKSPASPGWDHWRNNAALTTGAGNAWAPISADPERGLVFVPTGSAAPDFYGGERAGDNLFANSVVALEAATGDVAWHFQTVHHDLWDYDVASQPSLVTVPIGRDRVPAVAVSTKAGFLFLLNRDTGEPLFPVEERPVPTSDVEGELAWPSQPFPTQPAPLHPLEFTEDDVWGITEEDRAWCMEQFESRRNEGIFTPPSLGGSLLYPGNAGGMNWGGAAWDPGRDILVTSVWRLPFWVQLQPRASESRGNQRGTPYTMSRGPFLTPAGIPCNAPPWGTVVAIDLETGAHAWEIPLGYIPELAEAVPEARDWGSPHMGGPIVTAGGLVFIAASMDSHLRAIDIETGNVLWSAELPAGGQATPMTYEINGKQYVVIAAGGHPHIGGHFGDYVVAFALE